PPRRFGDAPRGRPHRGTGLEFPRRARPRAAGDRAPHPGRRRHHPARLQGPGPRLPVLPGPARRGARRSAAPHQGGPAGAGSVLEGPGAPRIVGVLYMDATTADLVRLAFNFTPHAYLDAQLEDVSIVLDNALWEGRFWLPYRQELEIRRRATWLDMPARGIIRARWEIDGYVFNVGLAPSWFQGDEITFLPKAERDSFPWREPTSYDEVRDVGDEPVIAPLLNSFSSQEFGADYGDYYRADGARLTYRHGSGVRGEWSAALGRETIHSLAVTAQPASGRFRPNPALGGVGLTLAQLAVRRRSEGFAVRRDVHYELIAEAGHADDGTNYLRLSGSGHVLLPAGATRLLVRAQGGAATRDPPAHRSLVLGG